MAPVVVALAIRAGLVYPIPHSQDLQIGLMEIGEVSKVGTALIWAQDMVVEVMVAVVVGMDLGVEEEGMVVDVDRMAAVMEAGVMAVVLEEAIRDAMEEDVEQEVMAVATRDALHLVEGTSAADIQFSARHQGDQEVY
jgi:hypothetical protein